MPVFNKPPIWMEALEDQMSALAAVNYTIEYGRSINKDQPWAATGINSWSVDQKLLMRGVPFSWSKETTVAVLQASKSIPLDTMISSWNLNTEFAWWHFEEPLPFQTVSMTKEANTLLGVKALNFGWLHIDDDPKKSFGMPVCCWLKDVLPKDLSTRYTFSMFPSQTFEWAPDETLGTMLEKSRIHYTSRYSPGGMYHGAPTVGIEIYMQATEGIARFILAGLVWLNQRIIATESGHIERHRRKEYSKKVRPIDHIRVIHLRRSEPRPHEMPEDYEPRKVDWSCRWEVEGFWRNQPYGPGLTQRKLRYIMPFLKGPEDKPFRPKARKVYEVSR